MEYVRKIDFDPQRSVTGRLNRCWITILVPRAAESIASRLRLVTARRRAFTPTSSISCFTS